MRESDCCVQPGSQKGTNPAELPGPAPHPHSLERGPEGPGALEASCLAHPPCTQASQDLNIAQEVLASGTPSPVQALEFATAKQVRVRACKQASIVG